MYRFFFCLLVCVLCAVSCKKNIVSIDTSVCLLGDSLMLTDITIFQGKTFISSEVVTEGENKGCLLKSVDGCSTFDVFVESQMSLNFVGFSPDSVLVFAGDSAYIYVDHPRLGTIDLNDNLSWISFEDNTNITAIDFITWEHAVAVGQREYLFGNVIFMTDDNWKYEMSVGSEGLNDVVRVGDSLFVSVGYGVVKLIDFSNKSVVNLPFYGDNLMAVSLYDDELFAVSFTGNVYKATSKGYDWEQIGSVHSSYLKRGNINDILVTEDGMFYACGEGGLLAKSDDKGEGWLIIDVGVDVALNALEAGQDRVYACGDKGVLVSVEM